MNVFEHFLSAYFKYSSIHLSTHTQCSFHVRSGHSSDISNSNSSTMILFPGQHCNFHR